MASEDSVRAGDTVLVIDEKGKKWMVRVESDKRLGTHRGEVDLEGLIGLRYGSSIKTHMGEKLWVLRPTVEDFMMKARRPTQIVYPKDLGFLIVRSGVRSGCRVAEAGTGSGVLTALLAWMVQPDGHVFSYDVREEFIRIAEKNLRRMGLIKYVVFKVKNVVEGIDERNLDAVYLDFDQPWKAVECAHEALRGGGTLSIITPTYNQAERVVSALNGRFINIETIEVLLRKILVRPGKTRPASRMIGYTALLTTGRKILGDG
ncbi:MAG: tRNA (adenine-N1)-methyltransferase [Candidatus Geothermarchaeales archaeon]